MAPATKHIRHYCSTGVFKKSVVNMIIRLYKLPHDIKKKNWTRSDLLKDK